MTGAPLPGRAAVAPAGRGMQRSGVLVALDAAERGCGGAGSEARGDRGDEVDRRGQDHRAEQVTEQGVAQHRTADRLAGDVGVADLVGHPQGEGQVGEVLVVGVLVLVEVDSSVAVVVEAGVADGEQDVHQHPGGGDAEHAESGLDDRRDALLGARGQQDADPDQARHRGDQQDDVGGAAPGVLLGGVGAGVRRVHAGDDGPGPRAVDPGGDDPARHGRGLGAPGEHHHGPGDHPQRQAHDQSDQHQPVKRACSAHIVSSRRRAVGGPVDRLRNGPVATRGGTVPPARHRSVTACC
ncbi:hypothetical protein SDC9_112640 [bioreactor metagenome]|uniref:Uncharacterized protein n=1 Tax=bioreactor metagenome TaxID=1076179 RepID=A0A645BJU2_9ZZZZ